MTIDDKSAISHAGERIIFKPTEWQKSLIKEFDNMNRKRRRFLLSFGFWRITFYILTTYDTFMMISGRSFRIIDIRIES